MKLPIVPSAKALVILALFAPIAVVVAATAPSAWIIAPAAALTLVVMILLDGLMAGGLAEFKITPPLDTEVGEDTGVAITATLKRNASKPPEVALGFDPRLGGLGTANTALKNTGTNGHFSGSCVLSPIRRGTAPLHNAWLRWAGPLGLGFRQIQRPLDNEIRIWPNLVPVRSPQLQAFLRDSQFGLVARRIRGEGTQFEALSEYQAGMDRRRIDWKASARHTALYARENEAERDNQIVFAFDCGQSMSEPIDGLPRIDRAVTAALTASYVALKGGDKVALFGFATTPQLFTPFVSDARAFHRLQSAAASLDYSTGEPNFTLALASLAAKLKRRSLIVLFSDFTDPTSAEMMVESVARLIKHHLVIFVTMEDSELADLTEAEPDSISDIATAVSANTLVRQRAIVLQRLRHLGVDVIEAPHDGISYQLIDHYLDAKRHEAIG